MKRAAHLLAVLAVAACSGSDAPPSSPSPSFAEQCAAEWGPFPVCVIECIHCDGASEFMCNHSDCAYVRAKEGCGPPSPWLMCP